MGSDADAEMTNSKRNIQDRVQLSSSKLGVPCSGMGSAKFVWKKHGPFYLFLARHCLHALPIMISQ